MTKPLTPLEAADNMDEAHGIASGLRLDEAATLMRSMAHDSKYVELIALYNELKEENRKLRNLAPLSPENARRSVQTAVTKHCRVNMNWPATAQIDDSGIDAFLADISGYSCGTTEPVAWSIRVRDGNTTYNAYTERLPFEPDADSKVVVLGEPVPLYLGVAQTCTQIEGAAYRMFCADDPHANWSTASDADKAYFRKLAQASQPANNAQAAREPSDEWCDAFLKATGEWIYPHEPEMECGVPMECEITQEDADEFNASAREQIRKGYAAALSGSSTESK